MRLCLARVVTPRLTRAMGQYLLVETVRGPKLHARGIGDGENFGATVLADVLGVVADQAVALASDSVLDLARGGELEALLHAALGLELGHFRLLCSPQAGDVSHRTRQPSLAGLVVFPTIWKAQPPSRGTGNWQVAALPGNRLAFE